MALYVTVSSGPRADEAVPILAVSDARVIEAMLRAIRRLATDAEQRFPHRGQYSTGIEGEWLRVVEETEGDRVR